MNAIGIQRLTKLAEFLKTLHPSKFNINGWMTGVNPELMAEEPTQEGDCGTTACAAGWLPLLYPNSWEWAHTKIGLRSLSYKERFSVIYLAEGLEHFFYLTPQQVFRIFYGQSYRYSPDVTPKMVARRIRSMVEELRG